MARKAINKKQNLTISLTPDIIRKAKVLAAQRTVSMSELLAEQIESLARADEMYEQSKRAALAFLERGFHLGGVIKASRQQWHER